MTGNNSDKSSEFWDALLDPKVYMDRSQIARAGRDEDNYRHNILYDMMRELAILARLKGATAIEQMNKSIQATGNRTVTKDDIEAARFHAYFAGCDARRAFTIAQMVLDLAEKRMWINGSRPIDFTKL